MNRKAPGGFPGLFCSNNWRCMRCFIPIRRLLTVRCRMVCPVFPAAPSGLAFQFPLFSSGLYAPDGWFSTLSRCLSSANIQLLQSTVRLFEHPSFLAACPGKTLQASFSEEGLHTTPGPGMHFSSYRQVPQLCFYAYPRANVREHIHLLIILYPDRLILSNLVGTFFLVPFLSRELRFPCRPNGE